MLILISRLFPPTSETCPTPFNFESCGLIWFSVSKYNFVGAVFDVTPSLMTGISSEENLLIEGVFAPVGRFAAIALIFRWASCTAKLAFASDSNSIEMVDSPSCDVDFMLLTFSNEERASSNFLVTELSTSFADAPGYEVTTLSAGKLSLGINS